MAKRVLYREWRPANFDEVVGQEHVVHALRQSVQSGEIAHAYLFSGTRGTGKTSLAKIYARAINCLQPSAEGNPCNECEICRGCLSGNLLDVIEMDAASNNSVDNIRRITDEVLFMPTLAKYKVYIIDEVHMLSTAAFNALLKTLEEPPSHAVFILATTDPQRIPATILSRCQRYDFKRIAPELMFDRLALIARENQIQIDEDGLRAIVARSEGALRDAISLLDQSRSVYSGAISREEILAMTGVVNDEFMERIVRALVLGDADQLLAGVDRLVMEGGDLLRFTTSLASYFRDLLVCKTTRQPETLLQLPRKTLETLKELAPLYPQAALIRQITHLSSLQQEMKQSANPRIALEVGLIQLLDSTKITARDRESMSQGPSREEIQQIFADSAAKETKSATVTAPVSRAAEARDPEPAPSVVSDDEAAFQAALAEFSEKVPAASAKPPALNDDGPDPDEQMITMDAVAEEAAEDDPYEYEDVPDDFSDENGPEAPPESSQNIVSVYEDMHLAQPEEEAQAAPPVAAAWKMPATSSPLLFDLGRQAPLQTDNTPPAAKPAAKPETPAEPLDLAKFWHSFIVELSVNEPLLAILLQNSPHRQEGKDIVIEIAAEHKATYDTMKNRKNWSGMEQAFMRAKPEGEWHLQLKLSGQDEDRAADRGSLNEPAWVKKMKLAASQLEIPFEKEEQ